MEKHLFQGLNIYLYIFMQKNNKKTKMNKKNNLSLTRKNKLVKVNKNNTLLNNFEKEITILFLEVLMMIKLLFVEEMDTITISLKDSMLMEVWIQLST